MLKISGNRLGEYNNSCRIFHNKSNKIGFAFSDFSTMFYKFSKIQQFTTTIGDEVLHRGPWKSQPSYKNTLGSHIRPLKDSSLCNAALGAVAGAAPAKFRPAGGRARAGGGREVA
jgi:hypothetical protein